MKYLPWGLLAIALLLGYGWHQRRVGELNGKIAHWQQQAGRVDTVYKTLTKTEVRVRRITDSVLVTDTVFRDTTVQRLIRDERAVCDDKAAICEQRVAYRDSIITALKKKPSVWSRLPWVAAGFLGGVLLK